MKPVPEFGRQFFISSQRLTIDGLDGWKVAEVCPNLFVGMSPLLARAQACLGDRMIMLLGDWYDPERPGDDNAAITDRICRAAENWDQLHGSTADVSGRWVLVVRIGGEVRIYGDVCGLKPVYYMNQEPFLAASQPALLARLGRTELDQTMSEDFNSAPHWGAWPIHVYPYPNVERLLPNHFLCLPEMEMRRYWPDSDLDKHSLADAAERTDGLLRGTLTALAERHDLCFSVTGGYDTRTLIACCPQSIRDASRFITVLGPDTPDYDVINARSIAEKLKLNYATVAFKPDAEFTHDLLANVGHMFPDLSAPAVASLVAAVDERTHCTDTQMSLLRNSRHLSAPNQSLNEAVAMYGFRNNRLATAGFERWFAAAPKDSSVNLHDLLYMEHRKGDWASSGMSFREAAIHQISPANNRRLIETVLSIPPVQRSRSAALQRWIIRSNIPALDNIPYNMTRRTQLRRQITARIPAGIKRVIRNVLN